MVKHNNRIPNVHFHKDWDTRVKCFFNGPAKKKKRRERRLQKAKRLAPRPVGRLRPIVRCPTQKYNMKQRLGRGFTPDELKAVHLNPHFARTIGIAVDIRRRNKSVEGLQLNVQRLKEYMSKLILFPRNPAKPIRDESTYEETKMAKQYSGKVIMPYKHTFKTEKARKITPKEIKGNAFKAMRQARKTKRYHNLVEKKKRKKLQQEEDKKKRGK